jgi:hypothetical protein
MICGHSSAPGCYLVGGYPRPSDKETYLTAFSGIVTLLISITVGFGLRNLIKQKKETSKLREPFQTETNDAE